MTCYSVNTEQIAYEVMENEIVIIHLDNGNYFNIEGIAIDIWNGILANLSIDNLVQFFVEAYQQEKTIIQDAIGNFIKQLESEELIIESTQEEEKKELFTLTNIQPEFTPPTLDKYEDMQDLLLLDPLHDVDENVGWPATK